MISFYNGIISQYNIISKWFTAKLIKQSFVSWLILLATNGLTSVNIANTCAYVISIISTKLQSSLMPLSFCEKNTLVTQSFNNHINILHSIL